MYYYNTTCVKLKQIFGLNPNVFFLGKRKGLTVLGYGLSTAVKPLMYIASTWGMVLGVRFTDRLGKGVRTAPRDALVADSVTPEQRGKAFGLHRAMDTFGAVVGIISAAVVDFLWQVVNPAAPFFFGAIMAFVAMIGFWVLIRE